MFSREPLKDSLKRLASDEEWQEFTSLSGVTQQQLDWDKKLLKPDPNSRSTRCLRIWQLLGSRLREKLRTGEWQAEGISLAHGIDRRRIESVLWDALEITPIEGSATGLGLHFVGITISQEQLDAGDEEAAVSTPPQAPGYLRRALADFLREKSKNGEGPLTRRSLLAEAKRSVSGGISGYLLDSVVGQLRRSGELPDELFFKGRPKSKGTRI